MQYFFEIFPYIFVQIILLLRATSKGYAGYTWPAGRMFETIVVDGDSKLSSRKKNVYASTPLRSGKNLSRTIINGFTIVYYNNITTNLLQRVT